MISVDQWRAAIGCFCPKALSKPIVTGEQGGDVVLALMYVLMIHIVFHIKMSCRTGLQRPCASLCVLHIIISLILDLVCVLCLLH